MGQATNGNLCYGIKFPEGYEFPWEKADCELDDWWLYHVCEYEPPVKLFDENGQYLSGVDRNDRELFSEYFAHKENFAVNNPVPVSLVNYQSLGAPAFIVAYPTSIIEARRGYPTQIDPIRLQVSDAMTAQLASFCFVWCSPLNDYDERPDLKPQWYLSSFWER